MKYFLAFLVAACAASSWGQASIQRSRWTTNADGYTIDGGVLTNLASTTYTNWNLLQIYTNTTGGAIEVGASAGLKTAAVSGDAGLAIFFTNASAGVANFASGAYLGTTASSLVVSNISEFSTWITNGGSFYFTNISSGTGNAGSIIPGSGYFTTF